MAAGGGEGAAHRQPQCYKKAMVDSGCGVHEHGDGDEQHGHEAEADHAGALGEQHLVAVYWISGVGAWLWRGRGGQVRGGQC